MDAELDRLIDDYVAAARLAQGRLYDEFHDQRGRPLTEKLEALGVDIQKFLRLVHFRDGTYQSQCESGSTLAFTSPGSRVVWVCSRPFVAQ